MASLTSSRLLAPEDVEDVEPMAGLGNLMDVMLVFACGLILALIAHYNVNLSQMPESVNMQQLEGQLELAQEGEADGSTYKQLGMVYQDERTGRLYVVAPDDETTENAMDAAGGADAAAQDAAGAAASDAPGASAQDAPGGAASAGEGVGAAEGEGAGA